MLVLAGLALGVIVTAAAWVALVLWAIDLGRDARENGEVSDWLLMVGVTLAAMVCLGILLWLIGHLLRLLGIGAKLRLGRPRARRTNTH